MSATRNGNDSGHHPFLGVILQDAVFFVPTDIKSEYIRLALSASCKFANTIRFCNLSFFPSYFYAII